MIGPALEGATTAAGLTRVAVYERTVAASLNRIWENVLDWEHLPWLHRRSFLGIELLGATPDGWRGRVTLPPASARKAAEIDVALDRPRLQYLTRTLSGEGTGTEILTRLAPRDARTTHISVEFHVPDVEPARADLVGAAYVRLYTQLWDEDEAMMQRRQALLAREKRRVTAALAPYPLGPAASLRARVPLVIEAHGQCVRIVEIDGELHAHTTVCPHLGGPLEDVPIVDGAITCPWHGYRFDVRSGANLNGRSCRLPAVPQVHRDAASAQAFLVWNEIAP